MVLVARVEVADGRGSLTAYPFKIAHVVLLSLAACIGAPSHERTPVDEPSPESLGK